ncbi:MAG: nitroreductase family protein [Desulfuromonadaceae bacterium]
MKPPLHNPRTPEAEVDSSFVDRWSPRALAPEPLAEEQIAALFEAARWSPSCYNEQPWLFLYATGAEDRERFASALVERNRLWASRAPLLLFVLTRLNFQQNQKPNRHAGFDAGAAWMALALLARRLGLYAHAMSGFNRQKALEVLGVSAEEYEVMAAVAVGRRGSADQLPQELADLERPNERKPLTAVARPG